MEPDLAGIVKSLTKAQRNTLIFAAKFLDLAAGEGVVMLLHMKDGTTAPVDAMDAVDALTEAFGLTLPDSKWPFHAAVRSALAKENDRGE